MKRKILSLALVLVMILSMLPMMFMTVAAADLTAPTTLPNGKGYTTTALTVDPQTYGTSYDPYSGWIGVGTTGALNDAGGIMFKVNTTAASGAYNLAFHLSATDSNGNVWKIASNIGAVKVFYGVNQGQAADATTTWYVSNDGATWSTITNAPGTVLMSVTDKQEELYVYIPYSEMYVIAGETELTGGTKNAAEPAVNLVDATELVGGWQDVAGSVMFCSDCPAKGTVITDFQFVTENEPTELFPNGYTTLSLFADANTVLSMVPATEGGNANTWLGLTSAANLGNGLNNAEGIMFKIDATDVAAGDDWLNLFVMMSVSANGKSSNLMLHSGGVNGYYADAQTPEAVSKWYVSEDGENWSELTGSSNALRKPVTNKRGVTYVYVPFSEMYLRHSLEYFTTGTNDSTKPGASFLEVKEACGGFTYADYMIQFFQDGATGTTEMKNAKVSEVSFVFAKEAPVELETPTALPDGTAFNSYNFFAPDKTLTYGNAEDFPHAGGAYTDYPYMNTAKATNALNKDGGVMFKVDATAATSGTINFAFRFSIAANNGVNNLMVFSHGDALGFYGDSNGQRPTTPSTWYISKDGETWTSTQTPTNGTILAPLAMAGEEMYVYIPYSSMYINRGETYLKGGANVTTETIVPFLEARELVGGFKPADASLQLCVTGGANGTVFSEFQFVTIPTSIDAPATLPDGKEFATESLFADPNKQLALNGSEVGSGKWIGTTSGEVLGDGFNNALGIMFKIDASQVAAGADTLNLMIMMSITGNNGIASNMMLHSGGVSGYYGDAQKPTPASTWYISIDGSAWTKLKDDSNEFYKPLTNIRGEIYVYVPFSEMYMRHSLSYYQGGANDNTQPGASFLDAKAACGGWKAAANMVQFIPSGVSMTTAVLSDFAFVYGADPIIDTEAGIFESVNITATDDIAYNLYAKIPAGATNVNMSFLFNGKTYTVVGVEQENGTVKYTLKNVLPQYMGQDIVATWTATVGEETVTDTYTSSVEDYLKAVLAGKHYTDMHDVSTALLYYGAAAQTVAGSTDAAVNTDVDPLPHPTNCKELPSVYNNGAEAIWTTAALRLSTTITLKVGVTAPEGITQVQYTIGEKTEVVDIKNGYVYIPVNAYQMMDAITVECFDGSAVTADGALVISASYYLNIVETEDADMNALLEAIANYAAQATIAAGGRTGSVEKAYSTVAQLALYDDFGGMSNVIQLTDGSFIIVDGGTNETVNVETLWAYLWRNSGYTKPVISAWIFTHLDLDHTGLGFAFLAKYKDSITVKTVGYTFPDNYQTLFAVKEGDDDQTKGYKNSAIGLQTERLATFESIKKAYPTTEFWDMEKGDVKTFVDVQAKVLLSANEVTASNPFEHNQLSAVIQFVFTQKTEDTADDTTYLVWGDSTPDRLVAVANEYDIKSDVMQATHHGLYGGILAPYQEVAPEITLLPVWENKLKYEYKEFETDEYGLFWTYDYNAYLLNNSDCYFHDTTAVVNMADLTVSIWK